ncbi:hypothetical protein HG537_0A07800 [Torulaspora globosa]|uniref:Uncharacterized protein n=1 Tax=Torulaspora globosa TaxID=48254 RepID=A0A7H9HML8_9SACH|nr:hypothetical protein HG537_0A07800 [Torulaspora sp. CBS 2947]
MFLLAQSMGTTSWLDRRDNISLYPYEVNRRRNNGVNSLNRMAIKKRCSTGIISIETFCEEYSSISGLARKSATAKKSEWAPALNVTVYHEPRSRNKITPISHYEHNMNHSLAARRVNTTQAPIAQEPTPRLRGRRSDYARVVAVERGNVAPNNGDSSGRKEKTPDEAPSKSLAKVECEDSGSDIHELLCDEILSAVNDDIFDVDFTFDNTWADNVSHTTCVNNFSPHNSVQPSRSRETSSNCSQATSSPVSTEQQDHEDDLETRHVSPSKRRISESKTKNSRFQLKLDNLRLKYQSRQEPSGIPNREEECKEVTRMRYWSNTADLRTKLIFECVNRELKHITRCSLNSINSEKTLLSILKRISSERPQHKTRIATPLDEKLTVQPAFGHISRPQSDVQLSDFLQKTLNEKNYDINFREQLAVTLLDQELQSCIIRGRDRSRNLWMQSEKFEFD